MRRVVVTGAGLITPLGCSFKSTWERLHILKNAVQMLPDLQTYAGLNSHLASVVEGFQTPAHYTRKITRTMGPLSVMALAATEEALASAGLKATDPEITGGRTGIAYGSSSGSVGSIMDFYSMVKTKAVGRITSATYVKMMPQTTAVNISLYLKTTGRIIPTNTACTSGSLSIGYAYETIKAGIQDIMIAGGAEEFSPTQVAVFDTLFATSTKNDTPSLTPSPYDKNRDGLVIGEGAGTLVLEEYEHARARGANILAEIVGFDTNTDGTHITQPNPETIRIVIQNAIKSAGLSPEDIGYVNGHGTSTARGDIAETVATANAFGREVPISSIKSYMGHTLGACGAIEAALTIEMMRNNWYAPTLNLTEVDPECGKLDYIVDAPRNIDTEFTMSNNFAFGGINTSLVFRRI